MPIPIRRVMPAACCPGVDYASRFLAPDESWGVRVFFDRDVRRAEIDRLASRAATLGLTVELVEEGTTWPYCAGDPGCETVVVPATYPSPSLEG